MRQILLYYLHSLQSISVCPGLDLADSLINSHNSISKEKKLYDDITDHIHNMIPIDKFNKTVQCHWSSDHR